jgi:poly-gamma-glutamate synthesis protein (capsule biosynthesis protein)
MSSRREFVQRSGYAALGLMGTPAEPITLCSCGDVMTGRGIDQILRNPFKPQLYESHMRSAVGYVELAERVNGAIPRRVDASYVWGDALPELARTSDLRIVNLETSVTTSDAWMPKGINYRMHPANVSCLRAAGIDCCSLANNHVLDWGYAGLAETLVTLRKARIRTAGAGSNRAEALAPAVLEVSGKGRVLGFALGTTSSGIPADWAATPDKPGVNVLPDLTVETAQRIAVGVAALRRPRDIVVASIHWGGNWGYEIPAEHRRFAHLLVDRAGVDVIHGHSSHHPKGIEVYRDKPILYGCGDFLNDYEGIEGHETYRSHLVLLYVLKMDPATQTLSRLEMRPFEIRRFRLQRASSRDAEWLRSILHREGKELGTQVTRSSDNSLLLTSR